MGRNNKGSMLVETPEKRSVYLSRMLRKICIDIGAHPVGIEANEQVVSLIKREMELSLPDVRLDTFICERWKLENEPKFLVGDKILESYPAYGSPSTPDEGLTGFLKRRGKEAPEFEIIDQNGKIIALTAISESERAIFSPYYKYNLKIEKCPLFIIGKSDVFIIEEAIRSKKTVRIFAKIFYKPNAEAQNIIGTSPGETKDEIILFSHLDTAYNSPGANNNTATLIMMLMLAHSLSGKRPKKTVRFIAVNGEEYGHLGMKHYANLRKRDGNINNIKFIINFNSVTWGPNLEVTSGDEELISKIRNIDLELNLKGTPKFSNLSGFLNENGFPVSSEARTVLIESDGGIKDLCWRRPQDTPDNVKSEPVEMSYRLFNRFLQILDDM